MNERSGIFCERFLAEPLQKKPEKNVKILITTDWYKPVINGVVTSVVNLEEELRKQGHEVRVLTLSENMHSWKTEHVTYIGSAGVGLIYPNARLKMALSHQYVQELVEWNPDVVHSQCEFSTFSLARKIAEACHAPLIHTYHTVYEDFTHYFSPSVRLGKKMAAVLSRRVLEKTNAVIAPTKKVSDMLWRYQVKKPVYIIPTGLELHKFTEPENEKNRQILRSKFHLREKDKVFLYVGRLAKEKNIEELFDLLKKEAFSDTKLLLIGDGPYRRELEECAGEKKIRHRVIFAGMVSQEKVAAYYKAGDIFVSASSSETQGLTYIEAMASALPVLCKKDPCLDSVIRQGNNGFVYENEEQFQKLSGRLWEDKAYREQIGRNAQESALRNFSAENFAENVRDVYCRCIEAGGVFAYENDI